MKIKRETKIAYAYFVDRHDSNEGCYRTPSRMGSDEQWGKTGLVVGKRKRREDYEKEQK